MSRRLPSGGRIDRSRIVPFTFDGRDYAGHPGDTLASALLANGVRVIGSSIYRGRARGVVSAGPEDPGALVQAEIGGGSEPMLRATEIELVDGLRAEGLAGRGRLSPEPEPAYYDKRFVSCDVLVVGSGPAGLAAADVAAAAGARVLLAESQPDLGGSLLDGPAEIDGRPACEWVADVAGRLDAAPEARVLTRTTALGVYDAGYVVLAERRTDHLPGAPLPGVARQRLWHVRARRVVLCTGAHERAPVFSGNDRPGVMLAGSARAYVERWAVAPGSRAVVFTTGDSAYAALDSLDRAGIEVACVVDARPEVRAGTLPAATELLAGHAVAATHGEESLTAVEVMALDAGGDVHGSPRRFECDLLAVSGGWNPAVHLFSHAGGRLRWDARAAAYVPDQAPERVIAVGAGSGTYTLAGCLEEGTGAGAAAVEALGFSPVGESPRAEPHSARPPRLLWSVPPAPGGSWDEHFVDFQRDATAADLRRAVEAGLKSPEHVKRFTTIGTANDQGKTSGVVALGILADLLGAQMEELGPTTYRPPYTPVSFALLAGRDRGTLSDPVRTTPMHSWHVAHGAVFEDVGQWKRPWFFPRSGESMDDAVLRECRAAREAVAVMDASTLGKIDVHGPDAVTFLNRMYTGDFTRLGIGRCKYGVLCHPDGMVFDDGVTMRLAEDRFLVTTTTGNAASVLDWFEEWQQTEWPELRVHFTSVTEQWATVAVVGPRSRDVMRTLAPGLDVGADAFKFMDVRESVVAGVPARVCRISFSGELAFEVNVAGWHGLGMWEAVMAAGEPHGITPYGTETMHVLRAEKGYVIVGQDTDGTVTPQDLGLDWLIGKNKGDFVGRRSFRRLDTARPDRKQLVGLLPADPRDRLPEGAQLVLEPIDGADLPHGTGHLPHMVGHVTSSYDSAALGGAFALALLEAGRERHGATVYAPLEDRTVALTVVDPVFYDPEGSRRDG